MPSESQPSPGASDDEIFAELEREVDDSFDIGAMRERRLEELKKECVSRISWDCISSCTRRLREVKDMRDQNHGRVTELTDEKEVMQISA